MELFGKKINTKFKMKRNHKSILHLLLNLLIVLSFFSCKTEKSSEKEVTTIDEIEVEIPVFNADTALYFIERQVAFGPRVPGSKGSIACAAYLAEVLEKFGAKVTVQEAKVRAWDGTILPIRNIIGSWQPDNPNRILLCAHWDTRPYADWDPDPKNFNVPIDGANDGGSGVGVLLEVARHLAVKQPKVGIDIIFFDAEDYGEPKGVQTSPDSHYWALGSQHWARNPHVPNYRNTRFGILLCMVGAYDATFYKEGYSMDYAPSVVRKVWDRARRLGHSKTFIDQEAGHIINDHKYVNKILGLPTINIIHQDRQTPHGFFKYWHTIEDTEDKISKETLNAVGETVIYVIYNES